MITEEELSNYTSSQVLDKGRDLYYAGHVGKLQQYMNDDDCVELSAIVISSRRSTRYAVNIQMTYDSSEILDYYCTCPYSDSNPGMCKHVVAVLLKYIYETKHDDDEDSIDYGRTSKTVRPKTPIAPSTSYELKSLLDKYAENADETAIMKQRGTIVLDPIISINRDFDLLLSFTIHQIGQRSYKVRKPLELARDVQNHNPIRYGKFLEFTGNLEAFEPASRALMKLLIDKGAGHLGGYGYGYGYSYGYSSLSSNFIVLDKNCCDHFMETLTNMPLLGTVFNVDGEGARYVIEDGMPDIGITLEPGEQEGFTLSSKVFLITDGVKYSYISVMNSRVINRIPMSTIEKQHAFLKELSECNGRKQYLAKADAPTFARALWPTVSEALPIKNNGFDAVKYAPARPKFEIYLDMPVQNMITCKVNACYEGKTFNAYDRVQPEEGRNIPDEENLKAFLSNWFNSYNEIEKILTLSDDNDMLYNLLTSGIPAMQERAAVFISDALKALRIRQQGHVHVGVSVDSGLLELNMNAESLSNEELAEILSKYQKKKRFYRLKNGDFVNLDGSLDELKDMMDDLMIPSKDMRKGKAMIPAFRALYLDNAVSEDNEELYLDRDEQFKSLVDNMKNIGNKTYEVPSSLDSVLHEYQKKGYSWLCALKDAGFSGLLADEMGLGKTLQVITVLLAWKDRGRTLVVCPASLVYNWSNEFRRFAPSLPVSVIAGPANLREEQIRNAGEQDILITSYNLLQKDSEVYQTLTFSCQIIDEAQFIKNETTLTAQAVKSIVSSFRIALTGTPIENRLSELWSIFDYLMPGFLYSYTRFRKEIEEPIVYEKDEDLRERLQRMVGPFILRRLKKEVLKDLPDKLEEVYYADLEGEQSKLYQARVQTMKIMLAGKSDSEFKTDKIEILAQLTRLRQLCCGPELIYDNYKGNSAKEDLCIDMIRSAVDGGHKVLLFSQFTTMLAVLEHRLDKEKIRYHELTGQMPKKTRIDLVDAFQSDDVPVFCISLKAGGTGLNLTAADVVIHYDPWWNTAVENQASDRAHRIGQKNTVTVCRLIVKDTIEEKIIELQSAKKDLADSILSGEEISSASLSREDLLKLL